MTAKVHPTTKARQYRLQRGNLSARLTPRQARRVRKTEVLYYNQRRGFVCSGFSIPYELTYK